MLPWLVPAVLSAAGTVATNQANRGMSDRQMRFQERMSSTAAQRAVADFRAAGLNPALAYGNQASSPGGATSTMGDPASSGVSSALSARNLQSQLRLMEEQNRKTSHEADKAAFDARSSEISARVATNTEAERTATELETLRFIRASQPFDLRYKDLTNTLTAAQIPERHLRSQAFTTASKLFNKSLEGYRQLGSYLPLAAGNITGSARNFTDQIRSRASSARKKLDSFQPR